MREEKLRKALRARKDKGMLCEEKLRKIEESATCEERWNVPDMQGAGGEMKRCGIKKGIK